MTMDEKEPKLWIDKLSRKHECYMHGDLIDKAIEVDGRAVTMRLPEYLSDIEVCRSAISGKVLFVLARQPNEKTMDEPCDGAFLIGSQNEEGKYEVHVWHELYPWALRYLGQDAAHTKPY